MKKNTTKQNIMEIKKIKNKMPKSLNEALNFNEREDNDMMDLHHEEPDVHNEMPMNMEDDSMGNPASEKAKKLIDDIRKMSLRAMADLADSPQDKFYENLKKIWQLCDKAVNERLEDEEVLHKHNQ